MAGMNLAQIVNILNPRMIARAAEYPLRTAARAVRSARPDLRGPAYWRAVLAELRRPHADQPPAIESIVWLGAIEQVDVQDAHTTLYGEGGALRVRVLAPHLFEIRFSPDGVFPDPFSYSMVQQSADLPAAPMDVRDDAERVTLSAAGLELRVEKRTGRLALAWAEGDALFDSGQWGAQAQGEGVAWRASFEPDAVFHGLGEKASGLNHAGQRFELWNTDPSGYGRGDDPLYLSVPFLLAHTGGQAVGLFFDNSHHTWVDAGAAEPGRVTVEAAGGDLRLYLMAGTPAEVVSYYGGLTGHLRLPPLWALGFHQSRWSYTSQQRVLEIAREFRARQLPCDVIHLDIHYMDGYRCFTWDRRRFPDPPAMLRALHEQGFKALSMIDPGIKVDRGYPVYDQGMARDAFLTWPDGVPYTAPVWPGSCHFPDFSDPAVREWWGGLYQPLLDDGVDSFWNDMNEFAVITADTRHAWIPNSLRYSKDGQGADHAEMRNLYGLLMVRASREGLERLRPDQRPLLLSRSGWAGLQHYALHWTGDNHSTWDHLRLTIPMMLNLGMSGIPFTGPDTGGFTGGPTPELFARWMQLSALLPFFRVHSMVGSADQEPWAFGPEVEAISRAALELRYRLLPYLYTTVWQAAQAGQPIVRSLGFSFPADPHVVPIEDQFMCGDALLAAPVLEEGATSRDVYLPAGVWFDWWTGQRYEGGQTITVEAPLDTLPLFTRGGAVVPLWPVQQYVGEKVIDTLELRVFWAAGEELNLLYEDDGVTPGTLHSTPHQFSTIKVRVADDARSGVITRDVRYGEYHPATIRTRVRVTGLPAEPAQVTADVPVHDQTWDAARGEWSTTLDTGTDFTLEITL